MKRRHNKKRNTAVVYEAMVKEATAAILRRDNITKNKIVSLLKKHFAIGSVLKKDLECYHSLSENQALSIDDSKRIIKEVRMQRHFLDASEIFAAQSKVIKDVNTEIDSDIFDNFVPNYKTLATIDQMFSSKTTPRDLVLLENEIIAHMSAHQTSEDTDTAADNLVMTTFVEKFNNKYSGELLEEQRDLLSHYILSFADNALTLKMFLNDEIGRLKEALNKTDSVKEIKEDKDMADKANKIVEKLNSYAKLQITDDVLLTILKTQALVKEIYSDASDD